MALHPEARTLLDQVAESGLPPLNELEPDAARLQAATLIEFVGPGPELPTVENFELPTSGGAIPARRYVPDDPSGAVLWIHGGGWVICDLDSHDAMCRMLAIASGAEVLAVHYRRAPEDPFPTPLNDSWDALRWLSDQRPGRPLVVGGDSAGGNMAAVCAIRARDRSGPELAQQVLVYPVTDCDFTTPSNIEHGTLPDTFLTTAEMKYFWHHYIQDPSQPTSPEACPLRTESLSGLAPAVIVTAEYDPLRDDGLAYVQKLRDAGVPVSHRHYDDMIHAFFSLPNLLSRGNEAIAQVGAEIRAAVAGASAPA